MERQIDLDGRVTVFIYDDRVGAQGRLIEKRFYESEALAPSPSVPSPSPSQTIAYTYDVWGRVVRTVDSLGATTENEYDNDGRLASVKTVLPDLGLFSGKTLNTVHYEYDDLTGQVARTWTTNADGTIVTETKYTYDRLGRLLTVEAAKREGQAVSEVTQYVYDTLGNLDRILNANNTITKYNYDELSRLKEVVHYLADLTPETLEDNPVLLRTAYTLLANGFKASETTTDADGTVHKYDWLYDGMGRLEAEVFSRSDASGLDYESRYYYDLVGNRLEKRTDNGLDGTFDEVVKSAFDGNDRQLTEEKRVDGILNESTEYLWGADGKSTSQTGKVVTDAAHNIVNLTEMEYNLQGRLSKITITTPTGTVVQEYTYDASGIKVRQTQTGDGAFTDTTYLVDFLNHTGYAQVLEETTTETLTDEGGTSSSVKTITYTIGHDVLSQFSSAMEGTIAALGGTGASLFFLYDGHGSTRAASAANGKIVQQYNYDAYGNAVGFNPADALTNLLYSGEQFNPTSGLQYLRARWYNPQAGRFNRVDPFAGNKYDPQSLHKYSYTHNSPIMGIDPSGNNLIDLLGSMCIRVGLSAKSYGASLLTKKVIMASLWRMASGFVLGGILGAYDDYLGCSPEEWTVERATESILYNGLKGAGFGLIAPVIPIKLLMCLTTAFSGYGVGSSLYEENYKQAFYRFILGTVALFSLAKLNTVRKEGDLVHMTKAQAAIEESGILGGAGGNPSTMYAGPGSNATVGKLDLMIRTGLTPGEYGSIPIPAGAQSAFQPPKVMGIASLWQYIMGTRIAPRGTVNLATGQYTPASGGGTTNLHMYGIDAITNSVALSFLYLEAIYGD